MKLNKILIYLLILLVVVAYAYFFELKKQKAKQAAEKKAAELVDIKRDQVTHIVIKSKEHGEIELKKLGGLWTLIRPVKTKADKAATDDWLHSITGAEREGVVMEKDVKWKEYGFDDPVLVAEVDSNDKSAKMTFGVKNPAGTSYYARAGDDSKLLLVQDTLKNSLDKSAFQLRDKTVVAIAGQDVESITYAEKDRGIELKKEDAGWKMVKPEAMRVKRELVDKDVLRLTNVKAKEIIDNPKTDDDSYGLKEPVRKIVLAGPKLDQTLLIGSRVKGDDKTETNKVYARVEGHKPVYVIDDWVLTKVVTDPEQLRDRSLFSFDPQRIVQVAIDLDGKKWQASRDTDKKWSLKLPAQKDGVDTWKVTSVLWDIKDLQWKERKKPAGNLSEFGLEKPRLTVMLTVKGQTQPVVLKAGWTDPPGAAENTSSENESKAGAAQEPEKSDKKGATTATSAKSTKPAKQPPKTVYAMVTPSDDESYVLVLDGKFVSGLRMDLDRLAEPEKSKSK